MKKHPVSPEPARQDRVCFVSLGCPKNLVDTELMAGSVLSSGGVLTFDPEEADCQIINTCAFLDTAREEACRAIREGLRWKKRRPGRRLLVAGCLTEYDADGAYREKFPGVDAWLGMEDLPRLQEILRGAPCLGSSNGKGTFLCDHRQPRLPLTLSHMAYLKVSDGCDNRCTFCAIPRLRGRLRTRTEESVLAEAGVLTGNGVRELILIGQDLTAFGHDRKEPDALCSLLQKLNAMKGNFKVRLLYTHPAHYTENLIRFLGSRENRRILPYLDIPLQHVAPELLKRMNRHTTREKILDLIRRLREAIPDLTLRTTFITGFPGETEEQFAELLQFLRDVRFDRCGVFPYSAETGTPAADFSDQVPAATAKARARKLMRIQEQIMLEKQSAMVGKTVECIVDAVEDFTGIARGYADAPEIDNAILIPHLPRKYAGQWIRVKITGVEGYDLTGKRVEEKR